MSKKLNLAKLTPVLFSFFVMGFVDIVNISTNYVKQDFALNDTWANLIPLLVFFWFAVISLPTGILMGRFGRKNTVLLSAAVTTVAMLLPLLDYSFPLVLTAFALLGIGNTILQVALNPLLMNVVPGRPSSQQPDARAVHQSDQLFSRADYRRRCVGELR